MIIKSFKSNRFAGLKDIHIEFQKGLNIIYGLNESGKSTLIDGIYATLFKDIVLRKSTKADMDFINKYFPYKGGDTIDGTLVIETEEGDFTLKKEWGDNKKVELIAPDGTSYTSKENIEEKLNKILDLGESTYNHVVFAKQRDLKESLDNILNNSDINEDINNILRMAFMELDGISVDSIEKNILEERENLYKRWDKVKNYPENNRGVNNPYKTGLGKILEAYYLKENLNISMENAESAERHFELISHELNYVEKKLKEVKKEKQELESIEGDIIKREVLEIKLVENKKKNDELRVVSKKWPDSKAKLKEANEKLENIRVHKEFFDNEKKNVAKLERKIELEKKISDLEKVLESKESLEKKKREIKKIGTKDIQMLESIQKDIDRDRLKLEVGKLHGNIKITTNKHLFLMENFEENQVLDRELEFSPNGFFKLNYANELFMEVKLKDIDFNEIGHAIKENENKIKELFNKLDISSIEEGKIEYKKAQELDDEIDKLNTKYNLMSGKRSIEYFKNELVPLEKISSEYTLESIEEEIKKSYTEEIDLSGRKTLLENEIKVWEAKYSNEDKLFDSIIECNVELRELETKLSNLKPLPEKFETIEDFKNKLKTLKEEESFAVEKYTELKDDFYEAKSLLPQESYEELKKQYLDSERDYERQIIKGQKIDRVYESFLETKEKMEENPLESLVKEFEILLQKITNNRYKINEMDDKFNLKLSNPEGEIRLDLLSAGTYDSVALALRFALVKHMFTKDSSYLILDDCLVDLDKERKLEAIDLINTMSQDFQIIFTTCNEDTARMLSDKVINL